MSVTIKQIAAEAGVARSVVSAVINDNYKYVRVSDEKRQVVRDVIKRHRFTPSASAQILTNKKTGIINFLIPSYDYVGHPDNARFIKGMNTALVAQGYRIKFTSIIDELADEKYLKRMLADAMVMSYWGGAEDEMVDTLSHHELPLLVVRTRCGRNDVSNLYYDIETSSYELTEHLLQQGYRHIVYAVGHLGDVLHQEAQHGIARAVAECDGAQFSFLPVTFDHKITDGNEQSYLIGHNAVGLLQKCGYDRPAVIFTGDVEVQGAMDAARDRGLGIPGDFVFAGRGNTYFSRTAMPAFSTIDRNAETAGERAGEILLELVSDPGKVIIEKLAMKPILR